MNKKYTFLSTCFENDEMIRKCIIEIYESIDLKLCSANLDNVSTIDNMTNYFWEYESNILNYLLYDDDKKKYINIEKINILAISKTINFINKHTSTKIAIIDIAKLFIEEVVSHYKSMKIGDVNTGDIVSFARDTYTHEEFEYDGDDMITITLNQDTSCYCTKDIYYEYIDYKIKDELTLLNQKLLEEIKNYKEYGTDESLSEEEKKQGILNTLLIVQKTISRNIEKLEYEPLRITTEKMEHTTGVTGRNQKLEQLLRLLKKANANYVLKDNEDNFFYPFIANIFFTHYETYSVLKKYEEILPNLKELEYQKEKLGINIFEKLNDEVERALVFSTNIRLDQIWRYTATVYAHKYNTAFKNMSKLIKFFIFEKPTTYNKSITEPIKDMPTPLIELDKFTKDI